VRPRTATSLSLLGLLEACPELLLEGLLGEALSPTALCALPCVQSSVAALVAGGGALLLWRMQLRRLSTGGLHIPADLLESLDLGTLRRSARALGQLRVKTSWRFSSADEIHAAVAAAEGACSGAADGSTLFAFTCRFRAARHQAAVPGLEAPQAPARLPTEPQPPENADGGDPSILVDGPTEVDGGEAQGEAAGGAEDAEEDPDGEWLFVGGDGMDVLGALSQLVFPEESLNEPIRLPDGRVFRVVPVICARSPAVAPPVPGEAAQDRSAEQLRCMMKPIILGDVTRSIQYEATLWSASPDVCAFDGLSLFEELPLRPSQAAALLGSDRPPGGGAAPTRPSSSPRPLRMVAAVRCAQRFWDFALS